MFRELFSTGLDGIILGSNIFIRPRIMYLGRTYFGQIVIHRYFGWGNFESKNSGMTYFHDSLCIVSMVPIILKLDSVYN